MHVSVSYSADGGGGRVVQGCHAYIVGGRQWCDVVPMLWIGGSHVTWVIDARLQDELGGELLLHLTSRLILARWCSAMRGPAVPRCPVRLNGGALSSSVLVGASGMHSP